MAARITEWQLSSGAEYSDWDGIGGRSVRNFTSELRPAVLSFGRRLTRLVTTRRSVSVCLVSQRLTVGPCLSYVDSCTLRLDGNCRLVPYACSGVRLTAVNPAHGQPWAALGVSGGRGGGSCPLCPPTCPPSAPTCQNNDFRCPTGVFNYFFFCKKQLNALKLLL